MATEHDYERKLLEAEVEIDKKDLEIEQLNQCLSRLSLTANNLAPALDQQLNELRRQIKRKSPIDIINKCIERISQEMLALDSIESSNGQLEFLKKITSEFCELNILTDIDIQRLERLMEKSTDESYLLSRFIDILKSSIKRFANKSIIKPLEDEQVDIKENEIVPDETGHLSTRDIDDESFIDKKCSFKN